jgi:hypothetical protein
LPAVLKKRNLMLPLLMMVTSPPLMPAPLKASENGLGTVKAYAGAAALNVIKGFIVHDRERGAYALTHSGRAALLAILGDAGLT